MQDTITIKSATISDRGLSDKRPENEDSYLEIASSGIYAVADGVGGAQAGDVASQMAVEILGEAFVNRSETDDAEDVMRIAAERANAAIHQMSREIPQLSTMATTLVALHINGNVATIGHVGDSRIYRFEPGKGITQETNDHSVVAEEVRAGRMTPEQAAHHPAKNVISRALGAESTVDLDLKTVMFSPGTTFLLCSDGVTRHIEDWELEDLLASTHEPGAICQKIKELCYERGAEDNLTAVVVRSIGDAITLGTEVPAASEVIETDDDEPTVSMARSPFDEVAAPISGTDPIINGNGHFGEDAHINHEEESVGGIRPSEDVEPSDRAEIGFTHEAAASSPHFTAASNYETPLKTPVANRLFIAALMLLIGTALGSAVMYYWSQSHPVVERIEVPVLQEKSTNVPLTAFEESRREVDRDPARYIGINSGNPQDAVDYYLLGRAYLLSRKYWDAKQAFLKARDSLSTADPSDAKTLASEISMGLAIINSGPAQEAFAKDVSAFNSNTQIVPPASR